MATTIINGKYRTTRRIGGGSFGEIYMGVTASGEKVAVKFERHGARCPQLRHEYKVYRELQGCLGFARVYYFGTQDSYNVMVMDLLGPSLEDLFNKCSRIFSLKTVLQLADQLLERVDTVHSRHLIHRDIKPANFVIGTGDVANMAFCVDFGLSKRYRHPKTHQHIPHRDGRSLTGTPRYASINNHLGVEQSRRDDLESIGYVLIYFLKGSLPWQGLKAKNAAKKYKCILEKKQSTSIAQLCAGSPAQFAEYLTYCRSLKFDSKPDIPYLRKLFRDLYYAQGYANDTSEKMWDWDACDAALSSVGSECNRGLLEGKEDHAAPKLGVEDGGLTGIDQRKADEQDQHIRPSSAVAGLRGQAQAGWSEVKASAIQPHVPCERVAAAAPTDDKASGTKKCSYSNAQWGFHISSRATLHQQAPPQVEGSTKNTRASEKSADDKRRPQTAQTLRSFVPPSGTNVKRAASADPVRDEQAHMVAGTRAMMQYRRSRGHSAEASTSKSRGSTGSHLYQGLPTSSSSKVPIRAVEQVGVQALETTPVLQQVDTAAGEQSAWKPTQGRPRSAGLATGAASAALARASVVPSTGGKVVDAAAKAKHTSSGSIRNRLLNSSSRHGGSRIFSFSGR